MNLALVVKQERQYGLEDAYGVFNRVLPGAA
jgi:hypothetical protein